MAGSKTLNQSTPLFILAGGFGTRLRALDAVRPKPMVLVKGLPFLHWLIRFYSNLGYQNFIFSTGYKAEVIETYDWKSHFPESHFEFFRESSPLGTGGAVQNFFNSQNRWDQAWIINGDTLLPVPLPTIETTTPFEAQYCVLESTEIFDATPNLKVQGTKVIGEDAAGTYFDAGAVFIKRAALQRFESDPEKQSPPFSFHKLLTPSMKVEKVGYFVLPGTCYDIGTPERFRRFEDFVSKFF